MVLSVAVMINSAIVPGLILYSMKTMHYVIYVIINKNQS
jgi:hypothetical protein